ncbi:hypothetical protein B9Z65_3132 [Elsinoe australis]|uniref:Triacylglycerol lipase n=1 Tax=Elsinoe australis TaxID=40998 RepID=A0A2P7ZUH3_9PEZI|nr:hypothetical protein B9Z65_3132 [Elsinoe australis]
MTLIRGRIRLGSAHTKSTIARRFSCFPPLPERAADPRIRELGRLIEDDYASVRANYEKPRNPIVLAHGLLGFDELHIAGSRLPGLHYWRGITEALTARGVECIIASVSPSGSIEARAEKLSECIARKAPGKSVNIIAHSMG